jgi:hypothetical protein
VLLVKLILLVFFVLRHIVIVGLSELIPVKSGTLVKLKILAGVKSISEAGHLDLLGAAVATATGLVPVGPILVR